MMMMMRMMKFVCPHFWFTNIIWYILLAFGFLEPASKEKIHWFSTWVSDDTMGTIAHDISNMCRGWDPVDWGGLQLIWVTLKQGDTYLVSPFYRNNALKSSMLRTIMFGNCQRWFLEGAHGDCSQGSSQRILAGWGRGRGRGRGRGPDWDGLVCRKKGTAKWLEHPPLVKVYMVYVWEYGDLHGSSIATLVSWLFIGGSPEGKEKMFLPFFFPAYVDEAIQKRWVRMTLHFPRQARFTCLKL